ncbi:hypothetical protein BU17DRAFT_99492 [Hysterangium stoloniferum]|nr:hypothetical protein BU17DRAFT_99492 [Hysterangium stoloniferum]
MATPVDIRDTFGACFVALLIAFLLYGISLLQTITYYMRYPTDAPRMKTLVAVVCTANTFQIILIAHGIYYYLVLNYFNPDALADGTWSFILEVVVTDVIACIVQVYFAMQLYLLSKQWFLAAMIAIKQELVWLLRLVGGAFTKLQDHTMKGLLLTHLTTSLAADIIITVGLCAHLQAARTGYSQTERLISKLLVYTVNRGILTGLSAFLELVFDFSVSLNAVSPAIILVNLLPNVLTEIARNTFIFIGIHFITSKFYTISFMATLNIRRQSNSHSRSGSNTNPPHQRDISLSNMSNTTAIPGALTKPILPIINITRGPDAMTTASVYSQPSLIKEPSDYETGETFLSSMGRD